jgi:hypothetical protein
VAACGRGAPTRHCVREKVGKQGEKGRQRCPPPRGALAMGGRDGVAAERRDGSVPELGGEGGVV